MTEWPLQMMHTPHIGWCVDGEPIRLRCLECGLTEEPGITWPFDLDNTLWCPRDGCHSCRVENLAAVRENDK